MQFGWTQRTGSGLGWLVGALVVGLLGLLMPLLLVVVALGLSGRAVLAARSMHAPGPAGSAGPPGPPAGAGPPRLGSATVT